MMFIFCQMNKRILAKEYITMENNCRSYQLAHSYDTYASKRHFLGKSYLPFSIQEEQNSLAEVPHPGRADNIFRNSIPPPASGAEALEQTPYHAVGVKEVKSYLAKADKRRRHMNSWVKRSTESNLSVSRCSHIKIPQERFMTKEEVLNSCKVPNAGCSQLNETYLLDTQLHSQNTSMTQTLQPLAHAKSQSHDFSMKRVMVRMKSYQKGWEKQTALREVLVRKEPRKHGKLRSILQDT